jgi:molecular chaperone GrpE
VGIRESAKADVAAQLIPLRDDLTLAEQHGDLTGPLKSVADKLDSVFSGLKIEAFGVEGDTFDPSLHEAVQDTSSGDEKVLGTVLRQGFRLGERTLRTAMVIIADPQ